MSFNIYDVIADTGKRFRNYRRALKISQYQLHVKTGVSMFTISNFENGKGQGISLSHFLLLLNALDLTDVFADIVPEIPSVDPEKIWKSNNKNE